jgi:imidazolonepropionase-like amidohydrolase
VAESYDLVIRAESALIDGRFQPASVAVSHGVIAAIGDLDAPFDATETVTIADGQVLIPGIVDTHVHVNEPGRTDWEGFASATRAAAARLSSSASTVTVGGMLLSGMSMIVVTPPAAAARVALAKPSQSVRPGSFT